jgi:hypothetical protein
MPFSYRMLLHGKREDPYYHDYVGFARWYYRGEHFPMYQIVWPSNDGYFPWSPYASDTFKEWQPVLGEAPKGL